MMEQPFTDDQVRSMDSYARTIKQTFCLSPDELRALLARLAAAEDLAEHHATEHASDCILSLWQAGEPTIGGGYRTMYDNKWYQTKPVDETPACTCGLDAARTKWLATRGIGI